MSKDCKRILITLRCDVCGRDLEHEPTAIVNPSNATVTCHFGGNSCAFERDDPPMTRLAKAVHIGYRDATPACTVPPPGWHCTRGAGHEGPCAAVPA